MMILSSMPNLKMVSDAAESKVAEPKKQCLKETRAGTHLQRYRHKP